MITQVRDMNSDRLGRLHDSGALRNRHLMTIDSYIYFTDNNLPPGSKKNGKNIE